MNNTIINTGNDFVVINDPSIVNKFFIFNFEDQEYLTDRDGITPIKFDSRFEAYKFVSGDEIVKSYKELPKHIKILLR